MRSATIVLALCLLLGGGLAAAPVAAASDYCDGGTLWPTVCRPVSPVVDLVLCVLEQHPC